MDASLRYNSIYGGVAKLAERYRVMNRQLIVNADDYGRSPGVSRGILEAHRDGIVTSTTVMINQPGIQAQLLAALEHPQLGIGLHLVFTQGQPVLPPSFVPGLVGAGGTFLDHHTLWARAERISLEQLRLELMAQTERFTDLASRRPDHLDCHHFVHLYPPFFQVYTSLAAELDVPLRVPIPLEPDRRQAPGSLAFLEGFPQDLVRSVIATNSAQLVERRLLHPNHFVATFFGEPALTLDHLFQLLEALPEGTSELMCHPGYNDQALAGSSYRQERETELALLTDPIVGQRVRDLGIELVTFAELRR
jgi:predicted glycoside hydrolase/deacetylase ChbG (UPF0249 family)